MKNQEEEKNSYNLSSSNSSSIEAKTENLKNTNNSLNSVWSQFETNQAH